MKEIDTSRTFWIENSEFPCADLKRKGVNGLLGYYTLNGMICSQCFEGVIFNVWSNQNTLNSHHFGCLLPDFVVVNVLTRGWMHSVGTKHNNARRQNTRQLCKNVDLGMRTKLNFVSYHVPTMTALLCVIVYLLKSHFSTRFGFFFCKPSSGALDFPHFLGFSPVLFNTI
jgi:hypothetical protein